MTSLATDFQNRLVPLCDGRSGLRGSIPVEVHSPPAPAPSQVPPLHPMERGPGGEAPTNPLTGSSPSPPQEERAGERRQPSTEIRDNSSNPCLDFVSSDGTLDRYREIITPAGWQLAAYQRNPVFQNSHQYGDIIFTLGRALITEIRQGRLFQRVEFATDANPMARIAYGLYSGKFLNAVSVGFIPIRWVDADGNEHSTRSHASTLSRSDASSLRTPNSPLRTYLEQELLEVSAVAIPANPNALALAYKSGAVEKSDLRDTLDLYRAVAEGEGGSAPATRIQNPAPHPLLSLAREVRDLMKHL